MPPAETAGDAPAHLEPLPLDRQSPQLTVRAVATGMLIGGVLSLCNIYAGLKIGWGTNMSITAGLLAFAFWRASQAGLGTRPFGLLENNINQTAASSAAAISSAGLVAAVPALTLLTGATLSWPLLALWTFSVCLVGITVAVGLRRQMILVDKLPFPSGIATAEMLREMYARGREALARVSMLLAAGLLAVAVKLTETLAHLKPFALPGSSAVKPAGATLRNLSFAVEPSVLMVGVGALVGLRAGVSLLVGAVLAYGVIAPRLLELGWAAAGKPEDIWFGSLTKWLLWPGVTLMVTSSLTSFAFSWRSMAAAFRRRRGAGDGSAADAEDVSRAWFVRGVVVALVLSVVCQVWLFDIGVWAAAAGVLLTFVLAIVAARVSGETNVTPVGPMGKITQLLFGVIAPGQPAANLMAANVTGGAASQCADLMHDLKTGWLIGASPRRQAVAQCFGAVAGALMGSAAYLILIPDPQTQLLTEEWPAPAAAAWKAVAELFMKGMSAMPPGAVRAMIWAGAAGILLAVLEKVLPRRARALVPSAASLGLAFVVPAHNAISMFVGAAIAALVARFSPSFAARFVVVIAAGLIAGESLTGVGVAIQKILGP